MMETYSHPFGEGGAAAGRTLTEVTTVATMIWQHSQLARARKAQALADAIAREKERQEEARKLWKPFLDAGYRADATLEDAFKAWYAAGPYTEINDGAVTEEALRALDGAEEVMRRENAYAMSRYDMRVRDGMSRQDAMEATAPDFAWTGTPGEPQPGRGMTEADARALHQALQEVAGLSAESVRAGRGPLTPQEAAKAVRKMDGIPSGMGDQIADGIGSRTILLGSAPSVADQGPAGLNWEGGARRHAGARRTSHRHGGRRTSDTLTKQRRRSGPSA